MIPIQRLGHVVLRVTDRARSTQFYTQFLGMHVMEEDARVGATFLGLRDLGNTLDLITSRDPSSGGVCKEFTALTGVGMHHFAFPVDSHEVLKSAYFLLLDNGVPIHAATDHGSTESIYFADPDGNIVEIYWERPAGWKERTEGAKDHDDPLTFKR